MANITSDVRRSIPFTSLTDPAAFPPYEHQEYPKMMLKKNGKPFTGADEQPILVHDADEEAAFRDENETLIVVNDRALNAAERSELEELRALREQKPDGAETGGPEARPATNRLAGLAPRPSGTAQNKGQQLKDRSGALLPKPIKSGNK